jgi:hypothetical protein
VIGILETVISGTAVVLSALILRKAQQIHVLVDGPMHELLARVSQLTGTLEEAGVDVPDKPDAA